jgi:hypothetical protein
MVRGIGAAVAALCESKISIGLLFMCGDHYKRTDQRRPREWSGNAACVAMATADAVVTVSTVFMMSSGVTTGTVITAPTKVTTDT